MLVPTVRCTDIQRSLRFYVDVLDFELSAEIHELVDPAFVVLVRGSGKLFLSSHAGDGVPGQAVSVLVSNLDQLVDGFRRRGLASAAKPPHASPVHHAPVNQTWGTREFYVDDPDGNTLRFIEGFAP